MKSRDESPTLALGTHWGTSRASRIWASPKKRERERDSSAHTGAAPLMKITALTLLRSETRLLGCARRYARTRERGCSDYRIPWRYNAQGFLTNGAHFPLRCVCAAASWAPAVCLYAAPRYTTRRLILKGNTDLSLHAARRVRFNPLWLDIALPLSRCLGNGDSCELAMEIIGLMK